MEFTISFYEGSYQFLRLVVEDTTVNNLCAGALNKLKEQFEYRATDRDLWAEIQSEGGQAIARVALEGDARERSMAVLLAGEPAPMWREAQLLDPTYELEVAYAI